MRKVVGVGLAAVLAFAGCSSSKPASTSGSPTTASQAATGSPIKVGLVCSCSGAFGAAYASGKDTYDAWVKTVNASGGINGHPIQLTTEDDSANPGTSTAEVHTLISDGVVAIVDDSLVDQAWIPTIAAANIPSVGGWYSGVSSPDIYPVTTTMDSDIAQSVSLLQASGTKNFGMFYCTETPACAEAVDPLAAAAQKVGIGLVYRAAVSASAPNYTAQCIAAQQAHTSFLIVASQPTTILKVAGDCAQQGYFPYYDVEGSEWVSAMGSAPGLNRGTIYQTYQAYPYFDSSLPAIKAMNTALDRYYPGVRTQATTPGEFPVLFWASGLLLRDAVKAAGITSSATPTSADIVKGLEALKGDTLEGLTGPLTYAPGKPHSLPCWFTARVDHGVPSIENGGKTTCMSGSA